MIVDFTPAARDDLTAIGEWIAQDNPVRAATFVDELIDKALALTDAYARYPEVPTRRHAGIRRMNHRITEFSTE